MRKITSILVLVFALSFTMQAQKRGQGKMLADMSVTQKATLAVKKMTLNLDLSSKQQKEMFTLMQNQINDKAAEREQRKAMRESGKKPTSQEIFDMANAKLDKQIAFKNMVKDILNKEQFEKFEKSMEQRKTKGEERGKKFRGKRK